MDKYLDKYKLEYSLIGSYNNLFSEVINLKLLVKLF
jgi:hypothetical protein